MSLICKVYSVSSSRSPHLKRSPSKCGWGSRTYNRQGFRNLPKKRVHKRMDQSKTAGDPGQKRTDDSWQDHGVTDGKRLWNCIISRGKTKEIFNSDNKSMFDELLDSISNAFEYWRYIYEKDDGFININFLRFFRLLLREICCEQLYDKTWKEYIE